MMGATARDLIRSYLGECGKSGATARQIKEEVLKRCPSSFLAIVLNRRRDGCFLWLLRHLTILRVGVVYGNIRNLCDSKEVEGFASPDGKLRYRLTDKGKRAPATTSQGPKLNPIPG